MVTIDDRVVAVLRLQIVIARHLVETSANAEPDLEDAIEDAERAANGLDRDPGRARRR